MMACARHDGMFPKLTVHLKHRVQLLAFKLQLRYRGIVTPGATHKGAWKVDPSEAADAMIHLFKEQQSHY
jgi:hypothetical protein